MTVTTVEQNPEVVAATRRWLQHVVVGLNFCPFAARELESQRVRFAVEPQSGFAACLQRLIAECEALESSQEFATTLLILPNGFADFADYLDLLEVAEKLLIEQGYEGIYQLASFHPNYCFADSNDADPANYSNRSPYPMLHLLREADVEQAIQRHPDVDSIPAANVERARRMGIDALTDLLDSCFDNRQPPT